MHNEEEFHESFKYAINQGKTCTSASMPNLNHLKMVDYYNVYEPSEDTFLLLDTLQYEYEKNNLPSPSPSSRDSNSNNLKSMITFELGCGTGVATIFLSNLLSSTTAMHYVTDINRYAINVTLKTAKINNACNIEAMQCDLAKPFIPKLNGLVDILLFNPPYVPTPNDEVGSNDIEASWAGGENGRIVIDRALDQIAKLISFPYGRAYMVVVDDNKPEEIARIMWDKYEFDVTPVLSRKARNEQLTILKMVPTKKL